MKQPKRLTRNQKRYLTNNGMDAEFYGFISEDDTFITVLDRRNNESVTVKKRRSRKS